MVRGRRPSRLRWRLSASGDEPHGQTVLILHGLLRQVVGLSDAGESAALAGAHGVARQQGDQDSFHHHHGDVFAHAGARPTAEGLEEASGHLRGRGGGQASSAGPRLRSHASCRATYCLLEVGQAELSGFGEEFRLVHEADVENDVGPFPDPNAVDGVVLQSFSHGEIHHGVKPHGLVDEALHHLQALVVDVLLAFLACK